MGQSNTPSTTTLENSSVESRLISGPRFKGFTTQQFELMINGLLNSNNKFFLRFNVLNELEVNINGQQYNVSQMLIHGVDFEQIHITDAALDLPKKPN